MHRHTNGNLGADSIAPIHTPGLGAVYVAMLNHKIAEMKETTGNRDVMSGGTAAVILHGAVGQLMELAQLVDQLQGSDLAE